MLRNGDLTALSCYLVSRFWIECAALSLLGKGLIETLIRYKNNLGILPREESKGDLEVAVVVAF